MIIWVPELLGLKNVKEINACQRDKIKQLNGRLAGKSLSSYWYLLKMRTGCVRAPDDFHTTALSARLEGAGCPMRALPEAELCGINNF